MKATLRRLATDAAGTTTLEYAFIAGTIFLVIAAAFPPLFSQLRALVLTIWPWP